MPSFDDSGRTPARELRYSYRYFVSEIFWPELRCIPLGFFFRVEHSILGSQPNLYCRVKR